MIALSVVAVGLIAVATVLGVRLSPSLRSARSADQRGESKISLQTLIIAGFALLLLAQVASALVIILTDDDGGSSSSQQAAAATTSVRTLPPAPDDNPCQPWEVFDPVAEDEGFGGPTGLGGIWSSLVGCVRVCYAQTWWGGATRLPDTTPYRFINASLAEDQIGTETYDEEGNLLPPVYALVLEYSLNDIRLAPEEGQNDQYATYQIVSSTQAGTNLDTTQNAELGERITVVDPGEEIRVSESQDTCEHIQTDTEIVFVDSDITRTIRQPADPTN